MGGLSFLVGHMLGWIVRYSGAEGIGETRYILACCKAVYYTIRANSLVFFLGGTSVNAQGFLGVILPRYNRNIHEILGYCIHPDVFQNWETNHQGW